MPFFLTLPPGRRLSAATAKRGAYERTNIKKYHIQNQIVSKHAGHGCQNAQDA
jgi:hypothetical protein